MGTPAYNGSPVRLTGVRNRQAETGSREEKYRKTTRTIAYIRVSLEKQSEGQSLEAQEAKCRAYAALHDLELVDVVVEAESAKSLSRPGLTRALAALGKTADAILVTKLDRLTRSVRDLGTLIEDYFGKGGATLLSVSESVDTRTAAGRMVLNIMASVSEWERSAIGERTATAMQDMRRRGLCTGKAPFGYRVAADGRTLERDDGEAATIARAAELRAEGLSLRAISEALAREGRLSRVGRPFVAPSLAKMLTTAA